MVVQLLQITHAVHVLALYPPIAKRSPFMKVLQSSWDLLPNVSTPANECELEKNLGRVREAMKSTRSEE